MDVVYLNQQASVGEQQTLLDNFAIFLTHIRRWHSLSLFLAIYLACVTLYSMENKTEGNRLKFVCAYEN